MAAAAFSGEAGKALASPGHHAMARMERWPEHYSSAQIELDSVGHTFGIQSDYLAVYQCVKSDSQRVEVVNQDKPGARRVSIVAGVTVHACSFTTSTDTKQCFDEVLQLGSVAL